MFTKLALLLSLQLIGLAIGQTLKSDDISSPTAGQKIDSHYRNTDSEALRWWTEPPILPVIFASSDTLPDGRSKKQVRLFLRDLANSTLWAVQMFDASTKYPDGVIYGHTKHLGNFDQCYDLDVKLPTDHEDPEYQDEIEGRYCLIRFRYRREDVVPTPPEAFTLDLDPNLNAWDAIDDRGDFRRMKRNSVYMALCVPASCSSEDVSTALTEPLRKLAQARGLRVETTVKPSMCQARRDAPKSFSTGTKVFCFFIATLVVLVIASSWYDSAFYPSDNLDKDDKASEDFFLCFSARRNLRSIFATAAENHRGLDCIHLIKFFFTSLTILGHRMMQHCGYPVVDSTLHEKWMDGYFSIGGVLLAYGLLEKIDRDKRLNFFGIVLLRFLRLTPVYMVVLFFHATILPHMGTGPFWEAKVGTERDSCSKNWWTNLLYIHNYVNSSEICMSHTWYLSADFHLFILGLVVVWTFWKLPRKFGYSLTSALIAIGIAIPFFITYANNLQPMYLKLLFMRDYRRDPYYLDYYIKSHMRIGPYMVGVLAGALIYDHKGSTWRISKTWSRILFMIFPVFLSITSQYLGTKYYNPNSVYDPLEAAAYAGFHRAAFALATCSIVVLITVGDGLEFHRNAMTPRWALPLARLTYGAFLIHHINQGYDVGVTRRPFMGGIRNMVWDFVPDVFTFGLSLLLSIFVEGPSRKVEKFIFVKITGRRSINGRSSVSFEYGRRCIHPVGMFTKLALQLLSLQLIGLATGQTLESDNISPCSAGQKVDSQHRNTDNNHASCHERETLRRWTEPPILPVVFASSDTLPEGRCKKQARRFLRDLANSTLWAVQMFDASTKYPDGVLSGHTKHLGNFDQCYDLRAKLPPTGAGADYEDEIEGRYCLIRFRYQRKDVVPVPPESFVHHFEPDLSVWNAVDERGDFRRVSRNSVYMSLCVPASCGPEDVSLALTEPLGESAEARGLRLETTVEPSLCQARRDQPNNYSTGAKVLCFIIAALVILVIASSWYDSAVYSSDDVATDEKPLGDIFLCFSARRNLSSIFTIANHHRGLDCIHTLRLLFTTLTILGHRLMHFYGYPFVNPNYLEKGYTQPMAMMLFNGPIIVDGFFSLGGLLLAYGLLDELNRRKRFNFTALILLRFLRLTPLYMIVVLFHATVYPHMGSGPFWEARIGSERDFCSKNWWTNLLYINNYVNANEMSWYLSADFHLYILGLVVVWAFWKLPRKSGYPLIFALIAIGTAIPFYITYANNLQALYRGLPYTWNVRRDPFFVGYYIKSHTRIGPYMVGVLAGALTYDHKGSTWRLSKVWSRILFAILVVGCMIGSQHFGAKYFDPNSVLDPLESAAYAGLHRTVFALGTCSTVVLLTIGDGLDFCYNILTANWVQPLARLTYGAFLVHNINQGYEIGVTRSPRVFTLHSCFWNFVPDTFYTFGLSLMLSLVVEGPLRRIEKFMLSTRRSRSSINGLKTAALTNGAMKKMK